MRIDNVSFANYPDALVLSGRMTPDRGPARDLWWRVDGAWEAPHTPGDPFAVGLLAPCMWMGEPLRIDAPVAPALLEGQEHGQRVLRAWYDALDHVPLSAPLQAEDAARANDTPEGGVACCFTGGVDSWYSLLAHDHEITHLLLVRGFDVALDDDVQWAAALSAARRAADETGKRLVTVSTNLRQVADMRRADWGPRHDGDFWGRILHGAALASVGLVLQIGRAHV